MNLISWLNNNSGASQVMLATALVVVTIYYAIQTRRTVKVLERQNELNIKPVVVIDHLHVPTEANQEDTFCIRANMVNIGSGAAIGILVEFSDIAGSDFLGRSVNAIDYLKPDGQQSSHHIHIHKDEFEKLRYSITHHGLAAELDCVVSFEDIHGRKYKTSQMAYYEKDDRKIVPEPGTFRQLPD